MSNSNYGKSDSGLNSSQYPLKYMMKLTFFGKDDYSTNDVYSFTVIRAPMSKTASFVIANINVNMFIYQQIQDHISRNDYPDLVVECWTVKNNHSSDSEYPPKVEDAFTKAYMVISVQTLESLDLRSPFISCRIILVNPVLLYLQGTNGFNQILEGLTPLDAIKKYEDWLKGKFGNKAFQFEHIGENYEKNNYSYEQILTRNSTDLLVPVVLINQYKTWNTYGYYFFDDFRLDDGATADITAYLINLGDKKQFPTFDIYRYGDLAMGLREEDIVPIHDPFNALYQKNTSIITKSKEMQFGYRKAVGTRDLPIVEVTKQDATRVSPKGSSIIKTTIRSTKSVEPTEETMIYAPDDHSNALSRFDKVSKQVKDDILSCDRFNLRDASFDYIQFGKRYNLNVTKQNVYDHIPISICNSFVREQGFTPVLIHNAQMQFFRYRPDEYPERKEQTQYTTGS